MPLARASSANCCFQPSKPAGPLPQVAACVSGLKHASRARIAKVAVVSLLTLVIRKSLGLLARLDDSYAAASRPSAPVASISRRSQPGAISKPFGQVGAPSSTNTRVKNAGSRKGSTIGPLPPTIAERSYSPAMPSLNVARRRYPSRHLIFVTLIIVETRNLDERRAGPRPPPIILQFAAMRQCPLLHEASGISRKMPLENFTGFDRDVGFVAAVSGKEMRRRVVDKIHPYSDAVEVSDRRHRSPSSVGDPVNDFETWGVLGQHTMAAKLTKTDLRRAFSCQPVLAGRPSYPKSSAASSTSTDASISATPSLRSCGCARGSPKTAGRLLPGCGRCSCRCRSACGARVLRAGSARPGRASWSRGDCSGSRHRWAGLRSCPR